MNENAPKVSIIVPVYNVEKYLRECLDSICGQTLREIEIICVDDGATDSSGTILDEYAAKDARVQVIHKQNEGQASARNLGLDLATGEYILFVDSDDFIAPTLVFKAFSAAEMDCAEMVLYCYSEVRENEIREVEFKEARLLGTSLLANIRCFFELGPVVWKTLWKREFLDRESLRFHQGLLWEDVPFTAFASFRARKVSYVPEFLYFYRINPNSTMNQQNSPTASRFSVQAFNLAWERIQPFNPPTDVKCFIFTEKLRLVYYGYTHSASKFLKTFRRNIREGVLPGELEMLRAGELDLLPLIRFFFLSIYGNRKERLNGKLHLFKFHVIRWLERTFHVRIYPS